MYDGSKSVIIIIINNLEVKNLITSVQSLINAKRRYEK